jgi:MFS transporter, DHA2 family, multidrug resistance protein
MGLPAAGCSPARLVARIQRSMSTPESTVLAGPGRGGARFGQRWSTLAVLCLGLFVLALDNTKLVVALPRLGQEFSGEPGALRWLPEAYLFVYACLLALGGTLSERFGARRLLLLGGVAFGLTSSAAALASSALTLLLARAGMGAAGALMTPATLATIRHTFDEHERPRAIAVWTASFGLGSALGPVLAGVLLAQGDFRSIFWINLPVAVVIVVGSWLRVAHDLPRRRLPLDWLGTLLSLSGTGLLLFLILEGPAFGPARAEPWLASLGALAAGFAFWRWERRARHPLFDLELFRSLGFRVAIGVIVLAYLAFAGVTFVLTQYLQLGRLHEPLAAGQLTLPVALAMLVGTLTAPLVMTRWQARGALLRGLCATLSGLALLAFATSMRHDALLAFAELPFGLGCGVVFATATDMVVGAATPERAGSAAALNETAFELGGVLGIALLSRVFSLRASPGASAEQVASGATLAMLAGLLAVLFAAGVTRRLASVPS